MSVVIKEKEIIITIPSTDPENDFKSMQSDIIFLMKNFDHEHLSYNFYQPLNLLDAMIPDRTTFEAKAEEPKYDQEALNKLFSNYSPLTLTLVVTNAIKYLYKYGAVQLNSGNRDIELEDTADTLKILSEVFTQMAKKEDNLV